MGFNWGWIGNSPPRRQIHQPAMDFESVDDRHRSYLNCSSASSADLTCSTPPIESANFLTSSNCSTVIEPLPVVRLAATRTVGRGLFPRALPT